MNPCSRIPLSLARPEIEQEGETKAGPVGDEAGDRHTSLLSLPVVKMPPLCLSLSLPFSHSINSRQPACSTVKCDYKGLILFWPLLPSNIIFRTSKRFLLRLPQFTSLSNDFVLWFFIQLDVLPTGNRHVLSMPSYCCAVLEPNVKRCMSILLLFYCQLNSEN